MDRYRLQVQSLESRELPAVLTTFDLDTGADPRGIIVGPDDHYWFSEFGTNRIGKLTQDGKYTTYNIPSNDSGPSDLAIGEDGNIWFTQTRAHRIGRITPSGTITEFPLPGGSEPVGITTGPDNRLWFTLAGRNQIGRLDPTATTDALIFSSLVTFNLPTAASRPLDIVAGPDNALWFTQSAADKIGRIATNGTVSNEYIVPGAGSLPRNIAVGPDNAMWFTQEGSDQIGRITTTGAVTEFAVPGVRNGLSDIGLGKDGNLWFTETDVDQIGRITPLGQITEFDVAGGPRALVAGPDRQFRIALERSNQIGRFGLAAPTVELGGDAFIQPGQTFERDGSFTDDEGLSFAANVDYGSGVEPLTLNGRNFTLSQTYPTEGKFTVDVRISNFFAVGRDQLTVYVDGTAPTATATAANHTTNTDYTFTVTYSDNVGMNASTFGDANILVTGPNGYSQNAVRLSVDVSGDGTPRTVTYRVVTPGGAWDSTDDGVYTLTVLSDAVKDLAGNALAAGKLGTFTVAQTVPPVNPPITPPVTPPTLPPIVLPPVTPPVPFPPRPFTVGADAGTEPRLIMYNPDGSVRFNVLAFESSFRGGVRVATADMNGDGVLDAIAASGPGRANEVRVFDGTSGKLIGAVGGFESSFIGGLFIAAADLNGDNFPDLAFTPDEGGGPRVRIVSGRNYNQTIADFFGIEDPNFRGGARIATGDMNGDQKADLLIGAGFGGGPRVAGFNGASLRTNATPPKLFNDFFVFEESLRNGVYLAVGDVNADGIGDPIFGGGPGGGPRVLGLSGRTLVETNNSAQAQVANFFAGSPEARGGIRLTTTSIDGDDNIDLIVGVGPGSGSRVIGYAGSTMPPDGQPTEAFGYDAFPGFSGGVFVG